MTEDRLVPRWYAFAVIILLLLGTLVYVGLAATSGGAARLVAVSSAGAFASLLAAATVALVLPRRPRPLEPDHEGVVEVASPRVLVGALLLAWGLLVLAAIVWVYLALTDFDAVEAPGATFLVVAGAVATVPDLVRLVTGRLHRWRLRLTREGLTYRGYRTDVTVPWSRVGRAEVQARGPAGIRVRLKGDDPDVVVPITAFRIPADQLAALVDRYGARR